MLETFESILENLPGYISAGALGILSILYTINKIKTIINNKGTIDMTDISNLAKELIVKAEGYDNWTGDQKKDYVMDKLEMYTLKNDLEVDTEIIDNLIESEITLSKLVNAVKGTD